MTSLSDQAPLLRLVWSNPHPPPRARPQRIDLALAIERHLTGADGLSEEEFVLVYSGRRTAALSLSLPTGL